MSLSQRGRIKHMNEVYVPMSDANARKVVTPVARLSYPSLHTAKQSKFNPDKKPEYEATLLFPYPLKSEEMKPLRMAVRAAAIEGWPDEAKRPKDLLKVFKDGNEQSDKEGYADTIVIRASNQRKPRLGDRNKEPVAEGSDLFYPGCYVRAILTAAPYGHKKGGPPNKGVKFYLEALQFVRDGERMGGTGGASLDDFPDDLDDDTEDNSEEAGEDDGF